MKTTPLNKTHRALGARMVDFAGWEMPVQYRSIIEEHLAVRKKAGIFDVSHMGEIEIRGPRAEEIVQKVTCNDASRLKTGDCQYSALLMEQGTFVDDVIVNRLAPDHFLVCVNASNSDKDFEWIRLRQTNDTPVVNRSDDFFQIALQGPDAKKILGEIAAKQAWPVPSKSFTFVQTSWKGRPLLIARTGYTGEDGFEFYGDPQDTEKAWNLLMDRGAKPCGLGARDTLRLEASYPLYGHEIDDTINPYEARLAWIVKINKGDFVGRTALRKLIGDSEEMMLPKMLVGMKMEEPGIPRQGCKVYYGEEEVGWVTSGTKAPFLESAVALAYVRSAFAATGTKIGIDIHHKKRHAVIVPLPFYKRPPDKDR